MNKKVIEIMDSVGTIENGFEDIVEMSKGCKFTDCTHTIEKECAVQEAISEGILKEERFHHYYRQEHEAQYVSQQKNKTKAIDYMKQRKMFQRP